MKQTAVEWLYDQMNNIKGSSISMNGRVQFIEKELNKLFEQAKAMEKEYLERFYNQGYTQCSIEDLKPTSRDRFVDAKDYYNKTFKSE